MRINEIFTRAGDKIVNEAEEKIKIKNERVQIAQEIEEIFNLIGVNLTEPKNPKFPAVLMTCLLS